MGRQRWARKLFEAKWDEEEGRKVRVGKRKSWRAKVEELVAEYDLQGKLGVWKSGKAEEGWKVTVRRAVEEKAIEEWKEAVNMRGSHKLEVYARVKPEWGIASYLEGKYGEGEVLKAMFRSGSAVVGAETRKWFDGGTGVYDVDGVEKKRDGLCRACDDRCLETLEHVLVECKAYEKLRGEWWSVCEKVGVGKGDLGHLDMLLGGKLSAWCLEEGGMRGGVQEGGEGRGGEWASGGGGEGERRGESGREGGADGGEGTAVEGCSGLNPSVCASVEGADRHNEWAAATIAWGQ